MRPAFARKGVHGTLCKKKRMLFVKPHLVVGGP